MKILKLRGYVLFLSLGLVLFFLGGLSVILVRTKSSAPITMPSVVGKNYISVHNELVRLRLKVNIEQVRIPEKNDGEILSQSIAPGQAFEPGSHIYLTVNQGFDRVEIPNLVGQTLTRGRELLEKVLSGEIYVPMTIGGITYTEAKDGEAADIILDQIPAPGKITHSGEKIYLLVSEKAKSISDQSFLNQPMPLVAKALDRKKFPYSILGFEKANTRGANGMVSFQEKKSGKFEFRVGKLDSDYIPAQGFAFIEYEIPESGTYQITQKSKSGETELLMIPQTFQEGEILYFAFYREGEVELRVEEIQTNSQKKFKFRPDGIL